MESVIVYKSMAEAIKSMSMEERGALITAYLAYGLDGKDYPLADFPLANMYMLAMRPIIDSNNAKKEGGKKGGRKPMVIENETIGFKLENHRFENFENNVNANANVNANENVNIYALPLKDGTTYEVSKSDVDEWAKAYPNKDIANEFGKMKAWLNSNPSKLKTRSGIKRFINGWLAREAKGYEEVMPKYKPTDWDAILGKLA